MGMKIKIGLSLKMKLLLICTALVVLPVSVVGFFGHYQLKSFSEETLDQSYHGLEKKALESLQNGVAADREKINGFMDKAEGHAKELASSAGLLTYLDTLDGNNRLLNTLVGKEMARTLEG